MDIGIQERHADLPERIGDIGFRDFSLSTKVFESVLKFI